MYSCLICGHSFVSKQSLNAHCRDKPDHHYCTHSDRGSPEALHQQHKVKAHNAYCVACEYSLVSDPAADHRLHPSFRPGRPIDEEDWYIDSNDNDDSRHCFSCDRYFVDQASLFQHLSMSPKHKWCFACCLDLDTKPRLRQHALAHLQHGNCRECPLCRMLFKNSKRTAIYVQASHGIFTQQLAAPSRRPPTTSSKSIERSEVAIVEYCTTERAWNTFRQNYECYLCHRDFRTLPELNHHIASPVHSTDEFRCPNKRCRRKFTLVDGLLQHLESGICGIACFATIRVLPKSLDVRSLMLCDM